MPSPIDPSLHELEHWRPGVQTRMHVSALTGSTQLCVFEQFCDPGLGAPNHYHDVEEILTVLDGRADVWINGEHMTMTTGQSAVVPPLARHGFTNSGTTTLHMRAILAAASFETAYDDKAETRRRWFPE